MPVLSRFYGIVIRMYFQQAEHNPPHIHAIYGEHTTDQKLLSNGCLGTFLAERTIFWNYLQAFLP